MRNAIVYMCALVGAVLLTAGVARAACGPGDPTGYYQGTAQSKEAGALKVAVNLRCDAGTYAGEVETPLGAFSIRDGSYAAGQLTLAFGQGPTGDSGTIALTVSGTSATGTFHLGADAGAFTLERTGDAHAPVSTVPTLALSAAQWRADLAFLADALKTRHVAPFDVTSRETFEREVAALDARFGTLEGDQAYVQLDHLANLIGDGHTYVDFPPDVERFPFLIRRFGDDYRIVAVTAGASAALLGSRLLAIDGNPIRRVHDALRAMTPVAETDVLREARITNFLNLGIALHGFGLIADRSRARFDLQDETGRRSEVNLQAMTPDQNAGAEFTWWAWKHPPLYLQQPNNDFWFTYLPAARTVYCDFRSYPELQTNAAKLLAFVRAHHAQRLAIDLRQNGGGDFNAGLQFLIGPLAAMPELNRKGRLFVLVGPSTFSAAMSNAAQFRTRTHALLVGETIGERPNSNQEPNEVKLPNSHLALRYSTKRYTFASNGPNAIVPDIQAAPTWAQFKAGDDPALEAVLRY